LNVDDLSSINKQIKLIKTEVTRISKKIKKPKNKHQEDQSLKEIFPKIKNIEKLASTKI
jgi:hypothetical protein